MAPRRRLVAMMAQSGAERPAHRLSAAGRHALALVAFFASGAAALAYEVTWTRALSLVLGSTTYAVSTMLATFMGGLALGALIGGRLADRRPNPLLYFGLCELGIGLAGIASVPVIYKLPGLYLVLYRGLHQSPALFFVVQILLCASVMALPTLLMGATFPLVTRALTRTVSDVGATVGRLYGVNTAGAVVGALLAGFVLMPHLGLRGSVLLVGGVNLVIGLLLTLAGAARRVPVLLLTLALYGLDVALLGLVPPATAEVSFYTANRHLGPDASYSALVGSRRATLQPLFRRSYPEGEVAAFRSPGGQLILEVGGKPEGTHAKDLDNTLLLAYLPLAAHPAPARALVVGLGAGVTLGAIKDHLREVEVVEIHPGVVEAVQRFGPSGLLAGVQVSIDDARRYLGRPGPRYDIISSEPSYPTEAAVANLFTREHFLAASRRLTDDGVYCQWLPYYILRNDDVTVMLKTFGSVFSQVYLFRVERSLDLLLLGSRRAFRFSATQLMERVQTLNRSGRRLEYRLSRSPAQVADIAARHDVPLNTDDLPVLEFRAVRNLLQGRLTD